MKSESVPEVETRNTGVTGPARVTSFFKRVGFVSEHVGAPGGEALVAGHVIARHSAADFSR